MFWFATFALEIVLFNVPFLWRSRKVLAYILLLAILGTSILSFFYLSPFFLLLTLCILLFRVLNVARVIKGRMHPDYLKRVTRRSSWWFMFCYVLATLVAGLQLGWFVEILPWLLLVVATGMLISLLRNIHKTRHIPNKTHYSDNELPTVSVCIPARNETRALEENLKSILANDYPKLEILVLDDCSQDQTAEVIKGFAHDGVRFVQGEPPEERWLAKNQAYDKLLQEATGELVLFCGVDVRLGSHAIRALVTTLLNRKKAMISVLPLRFYSRPREAFIQPMRYWWEMVPPRRFFNRPPVLSTCWLAERKKIKQAGGFAAVSHTIIPEGFFARHFIKTDEYSFIRADSELDVRTTKPFRDQWNTAVRTSYPQIRRRPEMALLLTLFTLGALIAPFALTFYALVTGNISLAIITGMTSLVLTMIHVLVLKISDPANITVGFLTLPVAVLLETTIGNLSMLRYEFGTVEWKERNICIPVMHVYPKLPVLESPSIKPQ